MKSMKLSAPWMTFYHELQALFAGDPEVKLRYDEEANHLKLFVDDNRKAEALSKVLPEKKEFGNVTMTIEVVPSNREETASDIYHDAFRGNGAVSYIYDAETPFGKMSYIVFKNEVVQFYNDQLDDINGNKNTLYQDIAREVFTVGGDEGVFFCTDAPQMLSKPLGEWP